MFDDMTMHDCTVVLVDLMKLIFSGLFAFLCFIVVLVVVFYLDPVMCAVILALYYVRRDSKGRTASERNTTKETKSRPLCRRSLEP